jgi:CHRD domain-containing protein
MTPAQSLLTSFTASAALIATAAFAQPGQGGVRFTANMTGAQEVPGPGDANATGTAVIRVNPGLRQICYRINVANIDGTINVAHIHIINQATGFGPPVVDLQAPVTGSVSACATAPNVTRAEALAIIKSPQNYYVNVHSSTFPNGAVRGGLTKGR